MVTFPNSKLRHSRIVSATNPSSVFTQTRSANTRIPSTQARGANTRIPSTATRNRIAAEA
ncbi:hypothetical protein DPMN_073183 [Dreissena polymorpha]|uniref:Uncharacterized protein n=1 Tax=Dreissena polymorpha TaxID=45954 RepID=A0A9D4BYK4_DREPO|nr:hypothetical protein DPMN_073183 [Dreissena polymorpha]